MALAVQASVGKRSDKEGGETSAIFARNLRRLRKEAGLSQSQLGDLAGLHRTEIGFLEAQKRLPRIDTFARLCQSLKARPDQLLEGIDFPTGGEDG